jgi:hypothetical protein
MVFNLHNSSCIIADMVYLVVLMTVIMFSQGIFLLLSHKWMPKLMNIMALSPEQSSILKIGVWRFRVLGIFHILLSICVLIALAFPELVAFVPVLVLLIPLIIFLLLGWITLALSFKYRKGHSKNPDSN